MVVSVVIPAFNAARTLGAVLDALAAQTEPPDEVIVVDDGSTDETADVADRPGVRVVKTDGGGFAGQARNRGWEVASGDVVVFLDSDAVPEPGWGAGLRNALREFPGAAVGCARSFRGKSPWGWVAHLQCETPYLPLGDPRHVPFASSYCLAVPRNVPVRFDPSYGGEDGIFCADLREARVDIVFDPRFRAFHDHERTTFGALRRQQQRLAYSIARVGRVERGGRAKWIRARIPLHYFVLLRLVPIYRRVRHRPDLREPFIRHLPLLIAAEWTFGLSALRYALRPPPLRGQGGGGFR